MIILPILSSHDKIMIQPKGWQRSHVSSLILLAIHRITASLQRLPYRRGGQCGVLFSVPLQGVPQEEGRGLGQSIHDIHRGGGGRTCSRTASCLFVFVIGSVPKIHHVSRGNASVIHRRVSYTTVQVQGMLQDARVFSSSTGVVAIAIAVVVGRQVEVGMLGQIDGCPSAGGGGGGFIVIVIIRQWRLLQFGRQGQGQSNGPW
mmetsp:Transcript_3696/g.10172  ORF Transcript_3696/g.10172 Transcript_3696/m.10172 type:complete len:203 (+) Transcript_3696:4110-4718(+)